MGLQPKSLLSLPLGRNAKSQSIIVDTNEPAFSNLQSLAAELHQSALQGLFEYSRNWVITATALAATLVIIGVAHLAAVGVSLVQHASGSPLAALVSWNLLGALLGVVLASGVAALLLNLFSSLKITPAGLGVSELMGVRHVPWEQVGVLRIMELPARGRYVVMIPLKGDTYPKTPAPMLRIIPALAGAAHNGERGLLITSDIKNFDRLLQLIMAYMAQAAGMVTPSIETFVEEDVVMPIAQLVLEPNAALTRISRHAAESRTDEYGVTTEDKGPEVVWQKVLRTQALIAAAPPLCLLIDLMLHAGPRSPSWLQFVWVALLLVVGVAELPFVARLVQAVGELLVGSGQFNQTVHSYLQLQTPRLFMILLSTALIGIGMPSVIAQMFWLAGVLITTVLATRYVQKLYYVPMMHALLASIGIFIFQASLLALYIGVR